MAPKPKSWFEAFFPERRGPRCANVVECLALRRPGSHIVQVPSGLICEVDEPCALAVCPACNAWIERFVRTRARN